MISEFSPKRSRAVQHLCHWLRAGLSALALIASVNAAPQAVDFNRDVRRVLSDNCFRCHGPDEDERKGGKKGARLRLDTPEGAQLDLGGYAAIVPGHPEKSDIIKRITTSDPDEKMPPASSGKKLTAAEISLLQSWIKQGAAYSRHWAYVKPERPPLPKVKRKAWTKNEIDYFILARLEREKRKPMAEADRSALSRRVALDLTGLPPTPAEVADFLGDKRPNAYERLVDRLLEKQSFGEHWARAWLDQARYADSAGYADDPARTIWAYRDYVIRAFNENKSFDQFTIEQLAGDLLPEATDEQIIATAFHRNTLTNNEGGTDDEEFRNVAVVDRVNTTMAVWMGETMACAQCHTHKYDPITQDEYFKFYAILNNTEDADRSDESPFYSLWTPEQKKERARLEKEIAPLEKTVSTMTPALAEAQSRWEKEFPRDLKWEALNPTDLKTRSEAKLTKSDNGEIQVEKKDKTDIYTLEIPIAGKQTLAVLRLETIPDGANFVLSRLLATNNGKPIEFTMAVADFAQEKFEAQSIIGNKDTKKKGWAIAGQTDKPHTLALVPKEPVEIEGPLTIAIEQLSEHESHVLGKFRLSYSAHARAGEFTRTPANILASLQKAERTDSERGELTKYFLTMAPELKGERDQLGALKKEFAAIKPITTVPVLRELVSDKRRKTRVQLRGNYLNLGHEVEEGLPSAFNPSAEKNPSRLSLAKWLVAPNNPLTARVTVNRYWESIFGTGIVRTSEDFGLQGDAPSHPELLDWLATEFIRGGWDTKHILKLMVTSAAYRQSSRVTPELNAKDPDNRLLARGPRFRLSAETIRDQAMFVSGLLSPKMYGPPVKPPQPKLGLSAAFGSATDWETSAGEDKFRRAIYTTWRRSNPYPSMATFDAPNREVCTVRRERSNTPLQALVTLNDPVYVEAAQALARRMDAAGATAEEKVRRGFEFSVSREPSKRELEKILELHKKTRARFAGDLEKAKNVATKPLGAAPENANIPDLAAWTVVANVLLNLDETLMKR